MNPDGARSSVQAQLIGMPECCNSEESVGATAAASGKCSAKLKLQI
jgi:hypothetical protein